MKFLLKLKAILEAGKLSADEKAGITKEFDALSTEEKAVAQETYEKAIALGEVADNDVEKELKTLLKGVKSDVTDEVMKAVEKLLTEQEEKRSKKIGIFADAKVEKRDKLNKSVRALAKALLKNDDTMLKEMTTDATGTPFAGYVVDSELSAEIRHLITEYGVAPREMMSITLSKGDLKANDLVTDVTVTWVEEAAGIKSTQVVLGQETLALKKLAAIVTLTNELMDDEEIDLFSFIAGRVAEKIAEKIDLAFFTGDGTSTYGSFTGILANASVNTVTMTGTTFASLDPDDLLDMRDATPQGGLANAKYYMHRTIRSIIRKKKSTDGIYVYQEPSVAGPATVWGDPIVDVEAMPGITDTAAATAFVIYGDLKKACIYGTKGAIKAKRFDAGVVQNVADDATINLITTDREAIRWTMRVGYLLIIPSALTVLKTAASSA